MLKVYPKCGYFEISFSDFSSFPQKQESSYSIQLSLLQINVNSSFQKKSYTKMQIQIINMVGEMIAVMIKLLCIIVWLKTLSTVYVDPLLCPFSKITKGAKKVWTIASLASFLSKNNLKWTLQTRDIAIKQLAKQINQLNSISNSFNIRAPALFCTNHQCHCRE